MRGTTQSTHCPGKPYMYVSKDQIDGEYPKFSITTTHDRITSKGITSVKYDDIRVNVYTGDRGKE